MILEIRPEKERRRYYKIIQKQVELFFKNKVIGSRALISFYFVSPRKIKKLNQKYRRLNQATDVLSFPLWEKIEKTPVKGPVNLGDVFICSKILKENAKKNHLDFKEELAKIIRHSLNHLVGKHH